MATDNPFLQYVPQSSTPPPAPAVAPAAPAAQPAPSAEPNPFAQFADAQPAEQPMDAWTTTVRGRRINFNVPRGSPKDVIRAAAKQAGVPDPENRSLQFVGNPDKVPTGPTFDQQHNNYGPIGTSIHQGVDFVAPVVDELAAGSDAAGKLLTGDTNVGGNYMNDMRWLQDRAANSEAVYPNEALGGKIGAFLAAIPAGAEATFLKGKTAVGSVLRGAGAGGAYAGGNAYASNPVDDRWNGVPLAAVLGTGIGAAAPIAAKFGGALVQRVDQRLGASDAVRRAYNYILGRPRNAEDVANQAAVDVMASRAPQDAAAMRAKAQEMRDLGHPPTLTNVVDESGRGVIASMARRQGPGREIAQQAYDARRLSAPERIDRNMATVINDAAGGDPNVAAALKQPLDQTTADLAAQRSEAMDTAMTPIRATPVPLNSRMFDVLNTADGQRAIGQAMRTVTDKPTIDAMRALQTFVRGANKNIPAGISPSARSQILDQVIARGPQMTVDIADRLARKFNAMAETAPSDTARALQGFAREVRDYTKTTVPAYGEALSKYSGMSKSIDAVKTGGDFLGPNNADEFTSRANKLSDVNPVSGDANLPSDRQLAMQGARRAVAQAAGENISSAPGVARKIAVSPEQSARNNALFGPINADKLERMMAITEKDLRDYAQIAPNTGSATALRQQDDNVAQHALTAMGYLKSGNPVRAAMHVLHTIGVRDQDATRIVKMATDPAQVDDLINKLEKSYGKQTAAKLGRILGLQTNMAQSKAIAGSR